MTLHTYSAVVSSSPATPASTSTSVRTSMASSSTSSVIDVHHPFFIHNGDNPGMAIVSQPLTDQNYQQWSRAVQLALSAKLKLGFIDGSIVKPANTSEMYPL